MVVDGAYRTGITSRSSYHPLRLVDYYDTLEHEVSSEVKESLSSDIANSMKLVPELEASIIMHNLGIAFLCMSFVIRFEDNNATAGMTYKSIALKLFRQSNTLYSKAISQRSIAHMYMPDYLRAMTAMLHSLIQTLQQHCIETPSSSGDDNMPSISEEIRHYISVMNDVNSKRYGIKLWIDKLGFKSITTAKAA